MRFAQEALGHNPKAVHQAYAKKAEVEIPSLDEWERQMKEKIVNLNPKQGEQPSVTPKSSKQLGFQNT